MNLPNAPAKYDQGDQAQTRGEIEKLLNRRHAKGANIEVGANCAVILTDTVTNLRYAVTMVNGVLTETAL